MRVSACVFSDKANLFKDFIDLFFDDFLISNATDLQSFCNDFFDGHTGVKRCNRILEDHLDFGHKAFLLGKTIIFDKLKECLFVFRRLFVKFCQLFEIFCFDNVCLFLGIHLVALLLVAFGCPDFDVLFLCDIEIVADCCCNVRLFCAVFNFLSLHGFKNLLECCLFDVFV